MYICFFVQISQFYEPYQRTLKLAVQRTAAALYANACLKPHQSLAAADGSAIVITKKSCGAEAVLSVVMQNQISDYRLPVPRRWLHPLSAGTVSEQICMICFDPSCARQE